MVTARATFVPPQARDPRVSTSARRATLAGKACRAVMTAGSRYRSRMRLVLFLILAACGSKASVEPTDCTDAVAHAQAVSEKSMQPGMNPKMVDRMKAMMAAATTAMTETCQADKWSPEVLACLKAANTPPDLASCEKLMTPEQAAHVTKAVTQATSAIKPK